MLHEGHALRTWQISHLAVEMVSPAWCEGNCVHARSPSTLGKFSVNDQENQVPLVLA